MYKDIENDYEKNIRLLERANFMQSSYWSRVKTNWEHEFITVKDKDGKACGAMLILIRKIPFLRTAMMYAPRGPVCSFHDKSALKQIFEQANIIAKKYRAYTLKIDPMIDENDAEAINNLCSLGFVHHPEKVGYDNTQCRENYVLDISGKTADDVFDCFKPKWRYNIRLAQRKGVRCDFYGAEALDDFERLMRETAERDGFQMRTAEYFEKILKSFEGRARLCMCYFEGKPLSGALMIDYGDTVSYVYGCSSNEGRNYMPNHLMQWTMIKYAADNGRKKYDFCGIPYWYDKSHRNYGVYRFKQGFNGRVVTYAGEFDMTYRAGLMQCARIMMCIKNHI